MLAWEGGRAEGEKEREGRWGGEIRHRCLCLQGHDPTVGAPPPRPLLTLITSQRPYLPMPPSAGQDLTSEVWEGTQTSRPNTWEGRLTSGLWTRRETQAVRQRTPVAGFCHEPPEPRFSCEEFHPLCAEDLRPHSPLLLCHSGCVVPQ